jgi:hypothetical protein
MREDKVFKQKSGINYGLVLIGFLLSTTIIIASTPIHEAAHWVMSEVDPYVEPVEYHVFDEFSYQTQKNVLPSALGSVVIKEEYPGAFNDRPSWSNILQEIICLSIQIFLAVIITLKIIKWIIRREQRVLLSMDYFQKLFEYPL